MEGEVCELCGAVHEDNNPVVLDDGLVCLECLGNFEMNECNED